VEGGAEAGGGGLVAVQEAAVAEVVQVTVAREAGTFFTVGVPVAGALSVIPGDTGTIN
jgi:hypothetical protein